MKKKLPYHYSGEKSRAFWDRLNRVALVSKTEGDVLYTLGCRLQNVEHTTLEYLNLAESDMEAKRPKGGQEMIGKPKEWPCEHIQKRRVKGIYFWWIKDSKGKWFTHVLDSWTLCSICGSKRPRAT